MHRVLVLFLFLFNHLLYAQCPAGTVNLNNQSAVQEYIANYGTCEVIRGDLVIGDATDISGITAIKRIEGSLKIEYSKITSVSNFSSLEFVGGDFSIDQSHLIETIEGLNKLQTVNGNFLITQNYNNLKNIKGFNALEQIGGNFQISENHSLETISPFDNLLNIDGWFLIRSCNAMEKLIGFNRLAKIGTIFNSSSFKGNLSIERNEILSEINGFKALIEVVRNIDILNHRNLLRVRGFTNFQKVRSLTFSANSSLVEIPIFDNLITIDGVLEISSSALNNINGFNSVQSIGWNLYFDGNTLLTKITGFENLNKLNGELGITNNKELTSLIGFANLIETSGINITSNKSIGDLRGLENLFTVGIIGGNGISIRRNISLSDCSAICNLLSNGSIYGNIDIVDNPSNCSSENEVRDECSPAGGDGSLAICINSGPVDLYNSLSGAPDAGGFWIPSLSSSTGVFNPSTDAAGVYTYTITTGANSTESSKVTVTIDDLPNAGADGSLGICINNSPVDLFNSLKSSPNNGGIWMPSFTSGTGVFDPSVDASGIYTYTVTNACGTATSEINVTVDVLPNAGADGSLDICMTSSSVDLFNSLLGTPDTGGIWTLSLSSGTGLFNPALDLAGVYTYTINQGVCGTETSEVLVAIYDLPNAGEDGSLNICINSSSVDLFDSLIGTPDRGRVWIPSLSSATGQFDPSIDVSGVYTYTVTNGVCGTATSEINVTVNVFPNAGEDGSLDICINSSSVDLFNSLSGTPETGGIWTPSLSSGTGLFNPALDLAGVYTYTIDKGVCGTDTSEVSVTIYDLPNAGEDGSLDICINSTSVDLFDSLTEAPDIGGIWIPNLSSGTGIFDPSIDTSGIYSYTVTNGACGTATSEINVTVNVLPNAGEDGSLDICINSGSVDLFNSLSGTPEREGIWSPKLASGTGLLNPAIDNSGVYTYTVGNGCGLAISEVMVTVTNATPISDYDIRITEFSGNNTIEIIINSNLDYQFSLDGIQYQNSNMFDNLSGGDYIFYVREINGCGILQGTVSILDFPKFFTPNNDGFNDFWKLKGSVTKAYDLYIYDRYGKLLKQIKSGGKSSWDGTYRGRNLPADDYWFNVIFSDGVIKNGHFTLKR